MKINMKSFIAATLFMALLSRGALVLAKSAPVIEAVFGKLVAGQPLKAAAHAMGMDVIWDEESGADFIEEPATGNLTETADISMGVKEGGLSAKEATFTIYNHTGREWIYGEVYKIEKKDENGWTAAGTVIENYVDIYCLKTAPWNIIYNGNGCTGNCHMEITA